MRRCLMSIASDFAGRQVFVDLLNRPGRALSFGRIRFHANSEFIFLQFFPTFAFRLALPTPAFCLC